MKKYNVAVLGATGAVGREMIRHLEERNFPVDNLTLLSSKNSAGSNISFNGKNYLTEEATETSFEGIDIALFSAGGSVSEYFAPFAVKSGAIVIDNTSFFRMDPEVPLVVPEVNPEDILKHKGVIANPNCSTIQMVVPLKSLHEKYTLNKVIVSTYQAVSGAGQKASDELTTQTKAFTSGDKLEAKILPVGKSDKHYQMLLNVIPQVDVGTNNGFTAEEMKMINETKKILHLPDLAVTATCVRVPVLRGHSESVYLELEQDFDIEDVKSLLKNTPGIIVMDDLENQIYPTPLNTTGLSEVFIGRIRRDLNNPRGLNLWIVADNLLKGAAVNSIQIAEKFIGQQKI